jgi:heptosyltransferase I
VKVLIIKLSSIGDIVHTIPSLNLLKTSVPDLKIHWLVYERFSGILESQTSIDEIKVLPNKKFSTYCDTLRKLQAEKYDLVIDYQGLIKTAFLARFSAKKSIGFSSPREKIAANFYTLVCKSVATIDNSKHIIEQNLELTLFVLKSLFNVKAVPEVDFGKLGFNFFADVKYSNQYSKVCIIPSTTWESKFWTNKNWIKLITVMREKFQSEIFLLGSNADSVIINEIASKIEPRPRVVLDKKLSELADFFREMSLIIGVDTGPLHIAAASAYPYQESKKKIIGIYGPTSAVRTGPYGFQSLSFDEIYGIKASHKRSLEADGASMQKISPEHVLALLEVVGKVR